jgi:hypothetical protein
VSCVKDLIGAEITRVIAVHDHRHFFLDNAYTLTFPSWVEISGRSSNYDDLEGRTILSLGQTLGARGELFEMVLSDGLLVTISLKAPSGSQSVQTLSLINPNEDRLVWKGNDFVPET